MWHDNETTTDYVNFRLVAVACTELIRTAGGEPISIGVSGGWGTGKSSLVRMIEVELKTSSSAGGKYVVVTFNPWLYQGFEDARTALLQIVGDAVLSEAGNNQTLSKKAQALLKRINFLRLAQLGGEVAATLITGVPVGLLGRALSDGWSAFQAGSNADTMQAAKTIPDATKGLIEDAKPRSLPQEIQGFRDALEDLLQELNITLVVFVDDLDRCLPKTTIATLEAIRLLLFLRRSAFVVAADDNFIRGAVRVHFSGTGIDDDISTNYFDKLIQVPLQVPRLGPNETKAYTALLFLENSMRAGALDASRFSIAKQLVEKRLQETWQGKRVNLEFLESLVPQSDSELLSLMGLAERLAPLLFSARAVQANPRLIKRFLNTVFLRKALARPQNINVDIPVLAKWHLLERCDANLANEIANGVTSNNDGRVAALHEAEKDAAAGKPLTGIFLEGSVASEWLQLEPKLGEIDLRPLLHLSRDTTVRDFGVDELTPAGKELRDALAAARVSSALLKEKIQNAGEAQAALAMARAWETSRPSRSWKKAEDVLMLVEVCTVFPTAGPRAAAFLGDASLGDVTPVVAHVLSNQPWAKDILAEWRTKPGLNPATVKVIAQAKGK